MSCLNVWVHLVWSTKYREPVLTKNKRQEIFAHMADNAPKKNIHLDIINGYVDHVHALVSLKSNQSVGEVAQLLKGESSWWVNKNGLLIPNFEWQDEYFAISVNPKAIDKIRSYILNQEDHHLGKTFAEEYDDLVKKYGGLGLLERPGPKEPGR